MANEPIQPPPETKAEAESLIPQFQFIRVLNQDQNGRRISLLGTIKGQEGVLILERAAFPADEGVLRSFLRDVRDVRNLGANDIYRWYMGSHTAQQKQSDSDSAPTTTTIPDLKINLIYPCTSSHIRKYTSQSLRFVTETPEIYRNYIQPWIEQTQRTPARLDWIYNVLDGRTEQEDVVYRTPAPAPNSNTNDGGFLLLPDLNWDRRTVSGTHLLALVYRRDLSSVRDLRKSHVAWLKTLQSEAVRAAAKVATQLNQQSNGDEAAGEVDADQFKTYIHYPPTYYHFHVHVVHLALEAEGGTQAVGKAIELGNVIAWLESMSDEESGMSDVQLSFAVGERSELWRDAFECLKNGHEVRLGKT